MMKLGKMHKKIGYREDNAVEIVRQLRREKKKSCRNIIENNI